MTTLLLSAVLTLVGILVSDILYVIVNPRVSFEDK
jgi:peptide/nickel transport system permease protein